MSYRSLPILKLTVDINQLARFALAFAKVTVVEQQAGIAGCYKLFSESR